MSESENTTLPILQQPLQQPAVAAVKAQSQRGFNQPLIARTPLQAEIILRRLVMKQTRANTVPPLWVTVQGQAAIVPPLWVRERRRAEPMPPPLDGTQAQEEHFQRRSAEIRLRITLKVLHLVTWQMRQEETPLPLEQGQKRAVKGQPQSGQPQPRPGMTQRRLARGQKQVRQTQQPLDRTQAQVGATQPP